MGNDKVVSLAAPAVVEDALTELLRTGARRLIEAAVAAEFGEYLSLRSTRSIPNARLVVGHRSGSAPNSSAISRTRPPW